MCEIETDPPIQQIIDRALVPFFLEFSQNHDNSALQVEAVTIIEKIVIYGSSDHRSYLIQADIAPTFIQLLASTFNEDIISQVSCVLGHLAGDCVEFRDILITEGALPSLLQVAERYKDQSQGKITMIQNISFAISCLFHCERPFPQITSPLSDVLRQFLLTSEDTQTLSFICWTLYYIVEELTSREEDEYDLTEAEEGFILILMEPITIQRFIELLTATTTTPAVPNDLSLIIQPILKILGLIGGRDLLILERMIELNL